MIVLGIKSPCKGRIAVTTFTTRCQNKCQKVLTKVPSYIKLGIYMENKTHQAKGATMNFKRCSFQERHFGPSLSWWFSWDVSFLPFPFCCSICFFGALRAPGSSLFLILEESNSSHSETTRRWPQPLAGNIASGLLF